MGNQSPHGSARALGLQRGDDLLSETERELTTRHVGERLSAVLLRRPSERPEVTLDGLSPRQLLSGNDKTLKVWEFSGSGMKRLTPYHPVLSELLVLRIGTLELKTEKQNAHDNGITSVHGRSSQLPPRRVDCGRYKGR